MGQPEQVPDSALLASDMERQAAFFDVQQHRYPADAILSPPFHTRLEIEAIIDRLHAMGLRPGDRVVDFGAGSGRVTIPLLREGYHVTAVDVSDRSLNDLATMAEGVGSGTFTTRRDLPRDGSYDAVVGADILHHVDMAVYLPQMHESLVAQGGIVFSEPGALNAAWYPYLMILYDWSVERGVTTCTLWNLRHQLEVAGFSELDIAGLGLFPRSLLTRWPGLARLNDQLGDHGLARLFAYRYIVHART